MTHAPDKDWKGIGYKCTCGERFVTETALGEHILFTTDKVKEKPVEEEKKAVEPKTETPKETKTQAVATSPIKATATMVQQYASKLINDDRAKQFYAQVSLMARNNPKLATVEPASLLSAVMACVHLDLMPNTPEQYAFVIPYGREAQFQLGYKGLLELAYRTGSVRNINAELVFNGDEFRVELGTRRELIHRPSFDVDRTDYKNVTHAYATAALKDGTTVFEVLSRTELDKVQKTVKAGSTDAPWQKWPEAMAKKTAVKRLTKLLPGSAEDNRLKLATEMDSLAEVGRLRFIDGQVVSEDNAVVSEVTREAIDQADTKEELQSVLRGLDVKERKNAAKLVEAKLKEVA